MALLSPRSRSRLTWGSLVGIVCIALVLCGSLVQVAHSHPSGQADHDCSLCVSAHHVIQIVAAVILVLFSLPVVPVAAEPATALPPRLFFFELWSRPPPADAAFA